MANPLPEEALLYQKIKDEKVQVPIEVWDLMYHRIGDCLTAINLMCEYYLEQNEPMPIEEARKIPEYIRLIKKVIIRLTRNDSGLNSHFPEFREDPNLHPAVKEMFMHYIPNDTNCISLIIMDTIDPLDPRPIPREYLQKILAYSKSSKNFMERLRETTLR